MSKSKEVAEEYLSSLADLTVNSKPLINMLTMLADENVDHAPAIVQVIESHIEKVSSEIKLPILYLIDSIIKNVSQMYVPLFTQNIVNVFVSVFEKVDEKTRLNMYKLRQTWGEVFPARKLYELDLRVKEIDHAWPVTAAPPTSIHFNPKFLGNKSNMPDVSTSAPHPSPPSSNNTPPVPASAPADVSENVLRDQLLHKKKILIQLQQKKLELELMQTKVILEEQQKQATESGVVAGDEGIKQLSESAAAKHKAVAPSSVYNSRLKKTKIAPANTQIIEAVKSRDPRIARQQQMQSKNSEVTSKEQEIYNRQLAMLKTPVIEQVVPVTPVQRVLSESNAKGHITINIDRNREKVSERTKRQGRDRSKKETSPTKSKYRHPSSKDSKSSRSRSSKSGGTHSKDSKSGSKSSSSSRTNSHSKESLKNPSKNERSVSPAAGRHGNCDAPAKTVASIESSPAIEPPPPPIISRTTDEESIQEKMLDDVDMGEVNDDNKDSGGRKEKTSFKDLKGVSKGRNYMRRNRETSASPEKEGPVAGVDVDLRLSGQPEKQPRLLYEEENIADNEKSLVNASGKDVDFRLISVGGGSPSKKKLQSDSVHEQPPTKKSKNETFDELFGNEDVDLRKMTAPNLNPGESLPSPPPPPVISNGPSVPQIAAVAPLVVVDSAKPYGPDGEVPLLMGHNGDGDKIRGAYDPGRSRHRRTWADIKVKPEAEVKPLSSQHEIDPRKEFTPFDSPEKGGKQHFRDRGSHGGELDRLGRPLLYNKLPNDPRARRESLGVLDGRDTDMRRFGLLMDRDGDTNINVNMIVDQAGDQLRNGTMSMDEYNEFIKQVIYVNEKQKLREAQTKGRQSDSRRSHHQRGRRSPNRYRGRDGSYRHDDDRRERRHFNDIDERLHVPWRNLPRNETNTGYNRLPFSSGSNRSPFDSLMDHRSYNDRSSKGDGWDEEKRFRQLSIVDEDSNHQWSRDPLNSERTSDCVDVPPADPQVLELIAKDPMKSISIDGTARDIRFYGDTAVVMLSWDDPKEISFEDGVRRVAIGDMNITCALNESYGIFMINGKPHRIRLGAPTRELYIDGEFYEAHFGGPPIPVQIDGMQYLVQVEGPPPQVKIGKKRLDLISGRVNMIVDASDILPLYLDSKPQRFNLRSRPYVFRFVNSLKTLLVNEVPVDIEFGGVCRQISGYGNLHFLRLSMLPNGVVPGCVQILNMENIGVPAVSNALDSRLADTNSPPLTNMQLNVNQGTAINSAVPDSLQTNASRLPIPQGSLDILTSLMNGAPGSEQSIGFNYQVENKEVQPVQPQVSQIQDTTTPQSQPQPSATSGIPFLGGTLNINDLFQRLVASGIVQTTVNMNASKPETKDVAPSDVIDFSDVNTLKERYPSVITALYSGIQCSSCGVRFSPEETVKYSRHLDWHFRQNRREKDAARKMRSRKWYYDVSDWIQFEEIEDLEERAQSWFDIENTAADEQEQEDVKSVPAPQSQDITRCEVCRDQFDTYYNEEKEEWQLKPCIIVEDKYYHPLCYEDLISMPEESMLAGKTSESMLSLKDESALDSDAQGLLGQNQAVKKEDEMLDRENENEDDERDVERARDAEMLTDDGKDHKDNRISPARIIEQLLETKIVENSDVVKENHEIKESDEDESVIRVLLNELINCIVYKQEMMMMMDEDNTDEMETEVLDDMDDSKEEEIEVIENITVEQKKNIIAVDLIEKLDDDDDEVFTRPRSPSPVTFIPGIKIKQEPIDEMESPVAVVDQTITNVVSSIDGNVEMIDAPTVAPAGPSKIKINFNKPIAIEQPIAPQKVLIKDPNDVTPEDVDPEPLPMRPKKPRIAEREMTVYPTCVKGTEVSGLCTIM